MDRRVVRLHDRRSAAEDFRRIFEATQVPKLVLSPDLVIVAVNDGYLRATMTRRDQLVGQSMFDAFPDNPSEAGASGVANLKASLTRVLETHVTDVMPVQKYGVRNWNAPGEPFETRYWSPVNTPVLDEKGQLLYIIHRVEDVTDFMRLKAEASNEAETSKDIRTRLEQLEKEMFERARDRQELTLRLQAAKESLERLNRAKDEFLANVSHELRTPLTLLAGPIEALMQESSSFDPERRADVELLHRACLRLKKTVNLLIDYARSEGGFDSAVFEPVDLSGYTSELASLFRSAIEHAGLRFVIDCPTLAVPVYVDRYMWETIVLNLISNAVKFTREGAIEVLLNAEDKHVQLTVRDTGAGIAEEEQGRLFGRFQRGDLTLARVAEGAGIGLAVTREMVLAHGGSIDVRSEVGRGSTFVVTLPTGFEHLPQNRVFQGTRIAGIPSNAAAYVEEVLGWVSPDRSDVAEAGMESAPCVLLVEDNPDARGYLVRLLGKIYRVTAVSGGAEALEALNQKAFDLVVTDLLMVGMSGVELLRGIRNDGRNAATPVMIVSASATEEDRMAALAAGVNDYLVKPFAAREFLARAASLLAHGEYLRREQQLREETERAKARLELVLDSIPVGFLAADRHGRVQFLNERQAQLFGLDRAAMLDEDVRAVAPAPIAEALNVSMRNSGSAQLDYFDADRRQWWAIRIYPTTDGTAMISTDITARKRAELQLQESAAMLQLATDIAQLGYFEIDLDTDTARCSGEWLQLTKLGDESTTRTMTEWMQLVHEDDRPRVEGLIRGIAAGSIRDADIEYRARTQDGDWRHISSRLKLLLGPEGGRRRVIGTHLDITERKLSEERALHEANLDPLTNLPNRHLLYLGAPHALAAARRLNRFAAVLFVDLDGFKPINDTYGHKLGDELLQTVARDLRGALRGQDLLGRIGGDEFVAVLADLDHAEDAQHIAQHLIGAIEKHRVLGGHEIDISASIGISVFPTDAEGIERLVQQADWAMYAAKKAGRGRCHYFEDGETLITDHEELGDRLHKALDADEFYVVFQPVVDADVPAKVVAAEALLRWRQSDGSYLGPNLFIPAADSAGFANKLGDRLLRTALACRQQWASAGLGDLGIALNVSPAQFRHKDFVASVAAAIKDHHAPPHSVTFEIPDAALAGRDEATKTLAALKSIGVRIAIDGFGSGRTSLQQISGLSIDELKVDRAITGSLESGGSEAVDMIVAVGRTAHADVVAAGVESRETLTAARRRGCRYVQGFHIARPMPSAEFSAWLGRRGQRRRAIRE